MPRFSAAFCRIYRRFAAPPPIGPRLQPCARCAKQCRPENVQAFGQFRRGRNMAGTVEQKLAAQGVALPEPRAAMANYVGFVRTGNLLFISGQVCANAEGKLVAKGKLGAGVSTEQGYEAAKTCAVNLLAQ